VIKLSETTNTFLDSCKKAKDEIIALKKIHDEKGQKLKDQLRRIDTIVQNKGEILNNLEQPCAEKEKQEILADILSKVKS